MMWFLYFLVSLAFCYEKHDHDHHEGLTKNNIIEEISEHVQAINESAFTFNDVDRILKNLKICQAEESSKRCNLCLTSGQLFKWYGFGENDTISPSQLLELSNGVLYSIITESENGAVCKNLTGENHEHIFEKFVNKYGGSAQVIDEESLEHILENVNRTFGSVLNNTKCFDAEDVLQGSNASHSRIDSHDFEYVSAFIILKLLKRNCIAEHKEEHASNMPSKDFFVNSIFKEHGNGSHMSHENFEKLLKSLNIGNVKSTVVDDGHKHDGHDHRRRRSLGNELERCYSAEDILTVFNVPEGSFLNVATFQEVCPSLIEQIESGHCAKKETEKKPEEKKEKGETWQPWIGTMVSILIISLGSLIGVFVVPLNKSKTFPFFLLFMVSVGVAVLVGDAILHLFPHSLGMHQHGHDDHTEEENGGHDSHEFLKSDSFLWKCVLFLSGIFAFFTFEIFMHAFGGDHTHSHGMDSMNKQQVNAIDSHKHIVPSHNVEGVKGSIQLCREATDNVANGWSAVMHSPAGGMHSCEKSPELSGDSEIHYNENAGDSVMSMNMTAKNSSSDLIISKKAIPMRNFKSVVWMVLIGDTLHNFLDGVAIGAAFTEQWPATLNGGISTSIAILLHELPHELGDFAILLNSGLSIKQALLMNFLSSLSAFAGGILGVSLGTKWDAAPWIFAITAGVFIYIAVADMLPEILHNSLVKKRPCLTSCLAIFGMLLGFAIMFVLAAYEEHLENVI